VCNWKGANAKQKKEIRKSLTVAVNLVVVV
jgi:hypothetical protein